MTTLTVSLRVTDNATQQPTPVRLRITGPDGEYYPPLGHPAEVPIGRCEGVGANLRFGSRVIALIDGTCEVPLPSATPLTVEIHKGPEYLPLREELRLGQGQMTLRFQIERGSDIRAEGYYPGDSRSHFLSPHDALIEGQAEDLDLVNLLATVRYLPSQDGQNYPVVPNILAFSGQRPALEHFGCQVHVNTHNVHPVLGRLGLLYSHRAIYPLAFGGELGDDWSVYEWCEQCHRKRGLVVWTDAFRSDGGLLGGEALVSLLLGQVDALEFDAHERPRPLLPWYYRLLNAGWQVPLVGASGKDSNRYALGGMRTYARLTENSFSSQAWIEAVRAGRTFISNGPLLRLEVNGQPPGARIETDSPDQRLSIQVRAWSLVPFEQLELLMNGEVVGQVLPSGDPCTAQLVMEQTLPNGGWLAARCRGAARSLLQPNMPIFAHTSPVMVQPRQMLPYRDPRSLPLLREAVEQTRLWVERDGQYAQPKFRQQLLERCQAAAERLD